MVTEVLVSNGRLFFDSSNISTSRKSKERLNHVIQLFNSKHIADETYDKKLSTLISDLKSDVYESLYTTNIHIFGSAVNGFRSHSSDVDCYIKLKENGFQKEMHILKNFFLKRSRLFSLKNYVTNARVPIITIVHHETNLDCDISFSVPAIPREDVILNTRLLRKYSSQNLKIPATFRFYKHLLSSTGFSSVRTKGLSTYCHAIMFIYFLTHRSTPYIPHIDINTFETQNDDSMIYRAITSECELLLSYLRFISCDFDSSKFMLDIRQYVKLVRQCTRSGNMGQFCIPDPYVNNRDLGKYMDERNVYQYKLFCYKLLHFLSDNSLNTDGLQEWCNSPVFPHSDIPPVLNPECAPLFEAQKAPKTVNKRRNTRAKIIMRNKEECSVTVPKCLISKQQSVAFNVHVDKNFGCNSALVKMVEMIDVDLQQLQAIIVFENETLVTRAWSLLSTMSELTGITISTYKCKPCDMTQVYLTTYYHSVPKLIDTSTVKNIFVYKPSFNVPLPFWRMLYNSINSEVYFLIPNDERGIIPSDDEQNTIDDLAQHYKNKSNYETKYFFTLPLDHLRSSYLESVNHECMKDIPINIEVFKIISTND